MSCRAISSASAVSSATAWASVSWSMGVMAEERPPPPLRGPPPPKGEEIRSCNRILLPPWGRGTAKRWRGLRRSPSRANQRAGGGAGGVRDLGAGEHAGDLFLAVG